MQHTYNFTFIDLFCGIGGFRIALENLGGKCVFSCDIDKYARETYKHNFHDEPAGDITLPETKALIPKDFDVLCGGFPCQPFSVCGKRLGFADPRGTMFFQIVQIVDKTHPKILFLENVKGLVSHHNGETFAVICRFLKDLGYQPFCDVLDAADFNVPQHRERLFFVCFRNDFVERAVMEYNSPRKIKRTATIQDYLDKDVPEKFFVREGDKHFKTVSEQVIDKNTMYNHLRGTHVRPIGKNLCPTLTANIGTGGNNVPFVLTDNGVRKITPRECLNFQGFPKWYEFPSTVPQRMQYKQSGNSVCVPLVQKIAANFLKVICTRKETPSLIQES